VSPAAPAARPPEPAAETPPLPSGVDARAARCRALADYLRDLAAEAARSPEPGRQVWLTEQRNIVRERQLELGC
jgi:hypothetical protein